MNAGKNSLHTSKVLRAESGIVPGTVNQVK